MTMNIAEKKIIIEKALSPWLSGDSLEEAVIIWELRYSQQPTLAFQRFLSDICTTPALNAQRSKILQALIRSLTGENGMPLKTLPPEIAATAAPAAPVAATTAAVSPARTERLSAQDEDALNGCMQLICTVFARTPSDMNARLRELLLERTPALGLSLPAQEALKAWLAGGGPTPESVFIPEPALRTLVQTVHDGLCEFLSRARASQVLAEAMQQTANYYRGSFPLQRLWAA